MASRYRCLIQCGEIGLLYRQEEQASYLNGQDTAFRAKRTWLCGEKNPVFYFEENFRLQQRNMFGRAPSCRRSHDEERGVARASFRHSLTAKTPVRLTCNPTAGSPDLAHQQSSNTGNSTSRYGGRAFSSRL